MRHERCLKCGKLGVSLKFESKQKEEIWRECKYCKNRGFIGKK